MDKIYTFNEALNIAKNIRDQNGAIVPMNVLLGNGFSREYFRAYGNEDVFNYKTLFDCVKSEKVKDDKTLEGLFSLLDINNFELVIHELIQLKKMYLLVEYFNNCDSSLPKEIQEGIEVLKQIFIEAIGKSHPERPDKILRVAYENCANFLDNFHSVFTLNYDLMFYWVHMEMLKKDNKKFNDGFKTFVDYKSNEWDKDFKEQNIFYLHGGLHIFSDDELGQHVYKLKFVDKNPPLIYQIKEEIVKERFPLYVAEGNSSDKLKTIISSSYLKNCYDKLLSSKGTLFTYGVSFERDRHILDAICDNKNISTVFIGRIDNQDTSSVVNKLSQSRKIVHIYDAFSAKVWGN